MPQQDGPRLDERDHEIWQRYVGGWTQARLAAEYGVSQQRVSQVLAEVRDSIRDTARMDAALLAHERANALLAAVWPAAMDGDTKAALACLRVVERIAKALGTDAVEPLRVSLEQRLDVESGVVVEALTAALDALELTAEQRNWAAYAASAAMYAASGQEPPEPPPPRPSSAVPAPAVEVSEERDLEAEFREFAEREGFDPDGLDDDEEDDDDDG